MTPCAALALALVAATAFEIALEIASGLAPGTAAWTGAAGACSTTPSPAAVSPNAGTSPVAAVAPFALSLGFSFGTFASKALRML
jgi:hypothetical protein